MSLVIHQSQVADRALAITPSTYISGALFSNILARHCTTATTAADVVVPKYPISELHGNEKNGGRNVVSPVFGFRLRGW